MISKISKLITAFLLVHDFASLNDMSIVVKADQPVHCKYPQTIRGTLSRISSPKLK